MSKKKSSPMKFSPIYAYVGLVVILPLFLAGFGVQAAKVWLNTNTSTQVLGAETQANDGQTTGRRSSTIFFRLPTHPEPVRPLHFDGQKPNWFGATSSAQFRITEDGRTATNAGEMPPRYPQDPIKNGSESAHRYTLENGGITAQTQLPISVDSLTHELHLTTPTGTASITVLPDDALRRLYEDRALSTASAGVTPPITLTELNNQPAYAVQGTVQKKLFGVLPITFAKTVFVSANNGQTLQTVESALSKFFERFSY